MSETRNKSRSKRKWIKRAIITLILLLIAGALFFAWISFRKRTADRALLQDTVRVARGDISMITQAGGWISYADTVTLEAPGDGTIGDIDLRLGDFVNKGDVLLTITNELYNDEILALEKELEALDMSLLAESSMKSSSVRSPVAGRVKGIYVQKGDDLSVVSQTLDGVVLLSADDLMSVLLPSDADAALNDAVKVLIGEQTVDGRVTSVDEDQIEITFSDHSFTVGETAKVTDPDGLEIGTGEVCVKTPYYVIATAGIVSSIPPALNKTVSLGGTLINLEESVYSASYLRLLKSRQEALDKLSEKRLGSATTELIASESGVITELFAQKGSTTTKGAPALTLSVSDTLELVVNVDEMEIAGITVGKTCRIFVPALEGQEFDGTVIRVSQAAVNTDGLSRYPVTVSIENPTGVLSGILSGMTARADILVVENTGVLLVPAQAVQVIDGKKYVSVVDSIDDNDQTMQEGRLVEIQTGLSSGSMTEIISGLQEGDIVIIPTEESFAFGNFMF
ncbi:MAG: HlyD family efflux transporter periplasmic adaptor subunit [Oscillospiraceae bacterium]|nr:HlyD family efflux transporter periplasmic adaptor subunit [Oscillospiraceae bacterium]